MQNLMSSHFHNTQFHYGWFWQISKERLRDNIFIFTSNIIQVQIKSVVSDLIFIFSFLSSSH